MRKYLILIAVISLLVFAGCANRRPILSPEEQAIVPEESIQETAVPEGQALNIEPEEPLTDIGLGEQESPSQEPNLDNSFKIKKDTVIAQDAVGPSWISWDALPNADLVYVDQKSWDLWVMDEDGNNKQCLTCYDNNILGINFPLDKEDNIHWKGDPEAHPYLPIIFLKVENENSDHKVLFNTPSIGWDNDIWALDVKEKKYYRLTNLELGQGVQHSAISEDGVWYVYPLRYDMGTPGKNFGLDKIVFSKLEINKVGISLSKQFEDEPKGQMYYEPNDIHKNPSGSYTLLYSGTDGRIANPHSYEWSEGNYLGKDKTLQETPSLHEEFFMFSPDGKKISLMKGEMFLGRYFADLHISNPDFTEIQRITYYNDCNVWPDDCKPDGAQLSRLEWKEDGKSIFFGLWVHGGTLKPYAYTELHRVDFE